MTRFLLSPPALPGRAFSVSHYPSEVILHSKNGQRYFTALQNYPQWYFAAIPCRIFSSRPRAGFAASTSLPPAFPPSLSLKNAPPICGKSANRELIFSKSKVYLQRPAILYFSLSASRRRASSLENTQPQ